MPGCESYNEKQLLAQVARGSEEAFTQLFYQHHQKLGAFILKLTSSTELTQEIVQDVFLKIWLNRSKLDGINCFEAYLFTVAKHHAFNALKKILREQSRFASWSNVAALTQPEEDNVAAVRERHLQLVDEAIMQLPPQQQKIYKLSRNEGLKYEQIAQQLGISFETVKRHMHLALRFIRKYLALHKDAVVGLLLTWLPFSVDFTLFT